MIRIDVGNGEFVEREIPHFTGNIKPGCIRYGFLPAFSPSNILEGNEPYDMEKCRAIREKSGFHNYTWYRFLREVNFLEHNTAVSLCKHLLSTTNTVLQSMGMHTTPEFIKQSGASSTAEWYVGWLRVANRYWWYEKALTIGIPDPLYEPPPPMTSQSRLFVDSSSTHPKRFMDYAKNISHNSLEIISNAILYSFGYIPARPEWTREEEWDRALNGLFLDPFPLISMVVCPSDYINLIACEQQSGNAGFYPTPLSITECMAEMVGTHSRNMENYDWGPTPEARMKKLLESINDPCVGTGNFLWSFWNTKIIGEFTDINHSMVAATRALCALYAPWFTNSIFRANALDNPDKVREQINEQVREYGINEILARASFLNSISGDLQNYEIDPEREEKAEVIAHIVNALEIDQQNKRIEEESEFSNSQVGWKELFEKLATVFESSTSEDAIPIIKNDSEPIVAEPEQKEEFVIPFEEDASPLPELVPELVGEFQLAETTEVKTKTSGKINNSIKNGQMSFDLFNN